MRSDAQRVASSYSYHNLNINQKIQLKQRAIEVTGNKRYHLSSPDRLKELNELQIISILG